MKPNVLVTSKAKTIELEKGLKNLIPEATERDFAKFGFFYDKAKIEYQFSDVATLFRTSNKPIIGVFTAAAVLAARDTLTERITGFSEQKEHSYSIGM